jgi:hypothetical protein
MAADNMRRSVNMGKNDPEIIDHKKKQYQNMDWPIK